MGKIENYTSFAENVAKDDSHGYDQIDRNGNPNYDCSGLVIRAVDQAGIPVKKHGATYTGNMKKAFLAAGFKDVTKSVTLSTGKGLKRGDVLLNEGHHTAIYCGNGKMVDARINEKGKATGGKSGDQTGHEIEIHAYNNHPWGVVLRYPETNTTAKPTTDNSVKGVVYKVVTNTEPLNIRSTASTKGKVLGKIPKGDKCTATGEVSNGWYKITYKGITGWVSGEWIKKVSTKTISKGDTVNFTGKTHYNSSGANAIGYGCKSGKAKVTAIKAGAAHPYHLQAVAGKGSTVFGWVNKSDIS